MILVLDDDPSRHAVFRAAASNLEVVESYDIRGFSEALRDVGPGDLISLDHDLEGGVNVGRPVAECGCDAAELIVKHGPSCVPVLIHSSNSHGSQAIRRILVASGRRGRVSRVNVISIMQGGERAGIELIREAVGELLKVPQWPDDVTTDELLDVLGDDPQVVCPCRAARR